MEVIMKVIFTTTLKMAKENKFMKLMEMFTTEIGKKI